MREDLVEVEVVDVLDRDVDRDAVVRKVLAALPRLQQAAGQFPDVIVELPDLAVLFEYRDEHRRRDHAAIVADPARERLRADHAARVSRDLCLQVDLDFPSAQRIREAAQDGAVADLFGHHVLRVPDVAIALLRLEDTGREERAVAENRDRRSVVLDAADADRNLQVEVNGREPVHDRLDRLEIGIRVKDDLGNQHREAIRADAPVGRPCIRAVVAAQHAADAHQELIALRHAVEAVQELEVAKVQADHEVRNARILLHDAACLPVEAVLVVDARQIIVHRAKVLEVHVLLVLRAVADQEVHADLCPRPIVERIAANLE